MVRYIQLFGERCSGTNFVASLVTKNFRNVELTSAFGAKHWFLKNHFPRCRPNQSTDTECVRTPGPESADTLFLCVFRNPFDWIRSLHRRPYHASNHGGIPIAQFMRKPWLSFERHRSNRHWPMRDDGFWFIEEAPNVLRLRSMKIEHWLNLENKVRNFRAVRYETLLEDNGHLAGIAEDFDIPLRHPTIEGEDRYMGRAPGTEFMPSTYPPFRARDLEFIYQELDWALEEKVGYTRSDYCP